MENEFDSLTEAVRKGQRDKAKEIASRLLESENPADILNAILTAMAQIGVRFKAGEVFVPEVLVAARAMNSVLEVLEPALVKSGLQPKHCVVIGTVFGDLHDIGKNLVAMMLRGANFKVVDLGVNVSADKFLSAAREHNADIVALSALLTTTMPSMKNIVDVFKKSGIQAKIIVGGAPVTQDFADKIGANGYSKDAASAADLCKRLVA